VVACAVSVALGLAGAAFSHSWSAGETAHARESDTSTVFDVHTTRRLVALTFDDGPDPRWTPQVLDLLLRYDARATFFDTGMNALAHPDLVGLEISGGNEIADHTWSHAHLPALSRAAIETEIVKGAEAIRGAGAPTPGLFRPPYGASNDGVEAVAKTEGLRTVGWNVAVEHYVNHTATIAEGVDAVLGRIRPGSIILAHDGGIPDRARTMRALPLLLEGLKARHYEVVTIGTLLAAAERVESTSTSPVAP